MTTLHLYLTPNFSSPPSDIKTPDVNYNDRSNQENLNSIGRFQIEEVDFNSTNEEIDLETVDDEIEMQARNFISLLISLLENVYEFAKSGTKLVLPAQYPVAKFSLEFDIDASEKLTDNDSDNSLDIEADEDTPNCVDETTTKSTNLFEALDEIIENNDELIYIITNICFGIILTRRLQIEEEEINPANEEIDFETVDEEIEMEARIILDKIYHSPFFLY
ncbi:hypothetical protein DFJ63DRAFT_336236 [Scheffersomyces coipomensis]|uniref:uncharacterized protein n=1 Tax=Scheffersomyces coipomensis TaxID=1788519 RepID=UPI00315DEB80